MSLFEKQVQSLKRLEAEVKSLKQMSNQMGPSNVRSLQKTTEEVATKIRVDLELEKRKRCSDKYIAVPAKNKSWVMKLNPDYNPDKNRRTQWVEKMEV